MKPEIEKIKAVLSEINKRNVSQIISPDFNEIESIVITPNDDVTSLIKVAEIAVEALEDIEGRYEHPNDLHNINSARLRGCQLAAKNTLKQISEILERK